jgi:hypothetical protein
MTLRGLTMRRSGRSDRATAPTRSVGLLTPRLIVGFHCEGGAVCRSCAIHEQHIGGVIRTGTGGASIRCSHCGNRLEDPT